MKIMFFPNGKTAVFENGQQIAELQESWFMLYVQLITVYGIDPTEAEFVMPDGNRAGVIVLENGRFGWQIQEWGQFPEKMDSKNREPLDSRGANRRPNKRDKLPELEGWEPTGLTKRGKIK